MVFLFCLFFDIICLVINMDIENRTELSVEDLVSETMKGTSLSRKKLIYVILFLVFFLLLCIAAVVRDLVNKTNMKTSFVLLGLVFLFFVFVLVLYFVYPKILKRNYTKSFGPKGIVYNYIFHINRVDVNTKFNKGKVYYDQLKKIVETNEFIRLYVDKQTFFIVRKECFNPNDFIKIKKALVDSKTKYIEKIA